MEPIGTHHDVNVTTTARAVNLRAISAKGGKQLRDNRSWLARRNTGRCRNQDENHNGGGVTMQFKSLPEAEATVLDVLTSPENGNGSSRASSRGGLPSTASVTPEPSRSTIILSTPGI
jgi:hypothetical protein